MSNTKQRGVSIYIAFMIMTILLAIVLGLNGILVSQIKTVRNIGFSVVAFYAAETGIEASLFSCTDELCSISDTLDGATYSAQGYAADPGEPNCPYDPADVDYCVKSVGVYNQTKRGIQIAR